MSERTSGEELRALLDALRASEARQRFLLALEDRLCPIADPADIHHQSACALGEHLGASRVGYAEHQEDEQAFEITRSYTNGVPCLDGRHRFEDYGRTGMAELEAGRTVVRSDIESDPTLGDAEKRAHAALLIGASVDVPLAKAGRLEAVMFVHHREPHAWSAEELALLEAVAERSWAAVVRARAEEALREADRCKDEFLAMLAHELRNPLAPIRTAVGILRAHGEADPLLARCHDVIERQAAHMTRLLEDLLDVSRLSHGSLTLRRAPVRLQEVIDAAVETSRPLIDQRLHRLAVEGVDPDIVLDGDAARLTQVFANLLDNAAKYSHPCGRIHVLVEHAPGRVVVRVRDDGIGIPAEQQDRVFELFAQGSGARGHAPGGLGIGLSLARRIVDMHGGTIAIASAGAGRGTELSVSLPALTTARTAAASPAEPRLVPVPRCKVLVADDNVDAADTIALLLATLGCEVRVVYGGEAAVKEAERFVPKLVLLDLGMPGVDGFEACRRIRGAPWGAGMVLIAISGWGQDDDRQRSTAAGFRRHFVKPVRPEELVPVIRSVGSERADPGPEPVEPLG